VRWTGLLTQWCEIFLAWLKPASLEKTLNYARLGVAPPNSKGFICLPNDQGKSIRVNPYVFCIFHHI